MTPISDDARRIAAQYGADPATVQRLLDKKAADEARAGIPAALARLPQAPRSPAPDTSGHPPAGAPVLLVFPWDALCPDNRKATVARGRIINTTRYARTKTALAASARDQYAGAVLTGPVAVTAAFWLPDKRRRDVLNLSKQWSDALTGIVWADDSQIHAATVTRAGIDRDRPRLELTVRAVDAVGVAA